MSGAAQNSPSPAPLPRPRGLPIFSVYDGRDLIGDVFETARGFVTVNAGGDVAGPYHDRKQAAKALRLGRGEA